MESGGRPVNDNETQRPRHAHLSCTICDLRQVCPARRITADNPATTVMRRSRVLSRGDKLFREGDTLKTLYVVDFGCVKSCISTGYGREQVIKIHIPGDLIGLDALADKRHASSAQALETTALCRVTIDTVHAHRDNSALQRQLLMLASQEIASEQEQAILANYGAGQRFAMFLLQLSSRYAKRGFPAHGFTLSMSRKDLGSLLGLTVETLSRNFTRFQDKGLIRAEGHSIHLLSPEGLRALIEQSV